MKHPRRLTRAMKIYLKKKGYSPEEWLYISKAVDYFIIAHRLTGRKILILKERRVS